MHSVRQCGEGLHGLIFTAFQTNTLTTFFKGTKWHGTKKKKKLGKIEKPPFHCLIPRIGCINIMGCGEGSQGKEGGEDRREGRKERQERKKILFILETNIFAINYKLVFIIEEMSNLRN